MMNIIILTLSFCFIYLLGGLIVEDMFNKFSQAEYDFKPKLYFILLWPIAIMLAIVLLLNGDFR
jgi:hypothetical protein